MSRKNVLVSLVAAAALGLPTLASAQSYRSTRQARKAPQGGSVLDGWPTAAAYGAQDGVVKGVHTAAYVLGWLGRGIWFGHSDGDKVALHEQNEGYMADRASVEADRVSYWSNRVAVYDQLSSQIAQRIRELDGKKATLVQQRDGVEGELMRLTGERGNKESMLLNVSSARLTQGSISDQAGAYDADTPGFDDLGERANASELDDAQAELAAVTEALETKQQELMALNDRIDEVHDDLLFARSQEVTVLRHTSYAKARIGKADHDLETLRERIAQSVREREQLEKTINARTIYAP